MSQKIKIPEAVKKPVRCPLCHAMMDRKEIPSRRARILRMIEEANLSLRMAQDSKNHKVIQEAQIWGENLEASLKAGAAQAFMCHFCKITIGCNDPFVGRWDEQYAKGEKVKCPACDHDMRFFCTSTGYAQFKCPVKKCGTKWESAEPDRKIQEGQQLFDSKGEPIALPGVDRPIATPDQPSAGQIGPMHDSGPSQVTTILPPKMEGHA